jgi:hypothetical protein
VQDYGTLGFISRFGNLEETWQTRKRFAEKNYRRMRNYIPLLGKRLRGVVSSFETPMTYNLRRLEPSAVPGAMAGFCGLVREIPAA